MRYTMTPHEEEMLEEIKGLHARLAKSEKSRLKWILISILCFLVIGFLLWLNFR
jgi:hypothetical protein